MALGVYDDVLLAGRKGKDGKWIDGARDLRDKARALLREGIDPGEQRRTEKIARRVASDNTFDKALKTAEVKHRPALHVRDLPEFYIRLQAARISAMVKAGLELVVLTFLRPANFAAPDGARLISKRLSGLFRANATGPAASSA